MVETVDESVPSSESESSGDCFGDLDGSLLDQENDSFNEPIDLSSEELLHVNDGDIDVEKELSYLAIKHGLSYEGVRDFADLLRRLSHNIHKDHRTIMKINLQPVISPDFYHFGLVGGLKTKLKHGIKENQRSIT